jgi:hypothetical protein
MTSMAVTRRNSNRQFALEMFEPGLPLTTEKAHMMSTEQYKQSGRISRRKFLRAIGIGLVVSGTSSVLPGRAAHAQHARHRRFVIPEDRFGRLFPQLPSFAQASPQPGQSIAEAMNVPALSRENLSELRALDQELDASTPLWYYVLKEAEVMEGGLRLGPVGGRMVGEVIIGLLQLDRYSFLSVEPQWRPTLPTRSSEVTGDFRMVDFLTFAGVDPTSRGQ